MSHEATAIAADAGARTWRCPKCIDAWPADIPRDERCPSCGRTVLEIEWPRRLRRIGLILFGLALQALSGAMFFLIPPGANLAAWLLYIGLGAAGFLHMFLGFELARRDHRESERSLYAGPHDTASREMQAVPLHAMRCPRCEHSLVRTIGRHGRRCPECEAHFSLRDLGIERDDPAGEPAHLAPNELRLGGTLLVAAFILGMVIVAMVLTTLLATPAGP